MARVTIEDCMSEFKNRFELVSFASRRARQLANKDKNALVQTDGDKPAVLALREIADGVMSPDIFEQQIQQDMALADEEIKFKEEVSGHAVPKAAEF